MMGRGQKIVTTVLWGILVVVMLAAVGVGLWVRRGGAEASARNSGTPTVSGMPLPLERLWEVPAFTFTDPDGRTVTRDDLKGRPWVAAFVFTNCNQACPMMAGKLRHVQDETKGTDLRLVSFSLDPARDTPEVLKKYGQNLGADTTRWTFLRGTQAEAFATAKAMKVAVDFNDKGEIIHGDHFLLVDADGWVRGFYRSKDEGAVQKLAADAVKLAGGRTG